jgi:hypothetical protein
MALPTTIVSSATTTWSDHKNQSHGGAQRSTVYPDTVDDGTFYNLGFDHDYAGVITQLSGQANHKLLRVRYYLQRVGNPSGNVFVEARPTLGGGTSNTVPDLAVLWGTSKSVVASSIPTSGKNEYVFTFSIPATLPTSDSLNFAALLTISVQGDSSNYIKVYRGANGARGSTHDYAAGSQIWGNSTTLSPSRVIEISKSGARVFALDKTNNRIVPYKTDDNAGMSWLTESTADINSTANLRNVNTQATFHDLGTSFFQGPDFTANKLAGYKRSESSGPAFDPSTSISFSTLGTNVSGSAVYGGGRRTNGTAVLVSQGVTETVMGSARRRIKLTFYNGTSWSSLFDVVGSANTPDATLPADANHHDLRWAGIDPNGDCHIIYSKSDTSTLQYRKFKSNNTFTTINTMNGAVASATANYPVGQPTFSYESPDWRIHVPYVDNGTSTLKESRCVTTTTETSANWTLTQIVAANAETSTSNPAVLIADNAQGGKIYCFRVVPTTKGLRMTHDSGSNTWVTETDWRGATQVVGGISGFYVEDGIALVYSEEGTSPDELRYDRL